MTVSEYRKISKFQKSVYIDMGLSDDNESGLVFVDGELPEYQNFKIVSINPRIELNHNTTATPYIEVWIIKQEKEV
jgi:hypothetical protein